MISLPDTPSVRPAKHIPIDSIESDDSCSSEDHNDLIRIVWRMALLTILAATGLAWIASWAIQH